MSSDIVLSSLGQPFMLGMLYDARKHQLIPGSILWDNKTVEAETEEIRQPSTNLNISTYDSTESKTSLLDVNASLKASFLSGLIEVNGSAKYLKDQKSFINQSRVTFQYKATSHVKQLSMAHLGDMDPQQMSVIEKGFATHVVTKILYGANAFFVFDSEKLDASSVTKMEGSMEAVINKIPAFTAEGKVKVDLSDEEKSLIQKFSCKFYGDFILESNPATFIDAVKTFAELPKLMGEKGEKTVPVKVWLMPLKNLSPKAAELLRDLSVGLVRKVEEALEDVKLMTSRCNESLVDGVGEDFPQIQGDLHRYQKLCNYYTSNLQQALKKKLPSIREGKEDESSLRQLFDSKETSPFSHENLLKWLEGKEREINVIRSCVDIMEGIKIVHNQSELDREVLNPGAQQTLCFVFTSLESVDPVLDAMAQYLDSLQSGTSADVPWYYSDEVFNRIRGKARTFSELATGMKDNPKFRFLVGVIENDKHLGATIYHYKDGIMVTDDFGLKDVAVEEITDKQDLIWYSRDLTVDVDTINNSLSLSKGNKKVTNEGEHSYPENPRRFPVAQFMCRESLTRRSYWEVEWSNSSSEAVIVGVAAEKIQRIDMNSRVGYNPDSLGLGHAFFPPGIPSAKFLAMFCGKKWEGPCPPSCTRIGIFLDWSAGSLSFYMVSSNQLTHLYTFHTRFNDPVYAACWVGRASNYVDLRMRE